MRHYNTDVSKQVSDVFKLKGDAIPNEFNEVINLTYDISPDTDVVATATASNATSATILTTPTDRDFYFLGSTLTLWTDATATSTYYAITAVVKGQTINLNYVRHRNLQALTAFNNTLMLPKKIKIDRGTAISVIAETNVANEVATGVIFGYYAE